MKPRTYYLDKIDIPGGTAWTAEYRTDKGKLCPVFALVGHDFTKEHATNAKARAAIRTHAKCTGVIPLILRKKG